MIWSGLPVSKLIRPSLSPEIENSLKKLSPGMMDSLNKLVVYEKEILAHINANPQNATEFLNNPKAVFTKLGIPLDKDLATKLDLFAEKKGALTLIAPRSIVLPSGKKIEPRIKVKFTP
jgi:hypothetical protein